MSLSLKNASNITFYSEAIEKLYIMNSTEISNYSDYEYIEPIENLLLITILWPLIAIIGIMANLCVIVVLSTKIITATQYFIINLAISDMLFLMICPTMALINLHQLITYDHMPTLFANIICKADFYLTHLTVFITCLTLMSMTFDRYKLIMHPLKSLRVRSTSKAILINLVIWMISIVLSIPHGLFRVIKKEENSDLVYCANSEYLEKISINLIYYKLSLSQLNLIYTFLIAYLIPFIAILYCYFVMLRRLTQQNPELYESRCNADTKNRRRVLIMIALVTILFGVSWLPIHIFHFALKFFNNFPYDNNNLFAIKNLAHTLTYLNSMLNPFFYTIMGNNFRQRIRTQKNKYSIRIKSLYPLKNNSSLNKGSIYRSNRERLNLTVENNDNKKNNLNSIDKLKFSANRRADLN